ncbi:MAG: hypothetical protein JO097_02670 [Acidobacteriaceae bacterium]|nr:hypothetical protein [Acidobacteriaceae bacterium]MBV9766344.1 hypothetical protein [Acidobacteriaceae bacterium]
MGNSQSGPAVLAVAVVAAALALMLLPGPLTWLISLGGLTLLLILLAYDVGGYRTFFQSLAFSAVVGLCIVLASVIVYQLWGIAPADKRFSEEWLPITWLCATIVFCGIDRTRMGVREISPRHQISPDVPSHRTFVPEFRPSSASSNVPSPAAVQSESTERLEPESTPVSPGSAGVPIQTKPGKETMIYVNLVGEGLNVLRSVRAEHLGRDFYKIIDSMPEGEAWEYKPGQVVRCKKKNLSSGKALVATEEAPRAV